EVKGSDDFNALANDMLNRASLSPMLIAKTGDGNISYGLPNKFGREIFGTAGLAVSSAAEEVHDQIAGFTLQVKNSDGTVNKFANAQLQFKEMNRNETATGDRALSFHVGAEANVATKFALTDMRAKALGLKGDDDNIISISTKEDANAAINALDLAIEKVLDQQTTIGAALTRLDRTATNLTTTVTDDQSSESVIRDADMAKEMAGYAKYNLLSQTSQAMLAQANQNPLNVLYLLGLDEE
ncbi:MAG: flagellin, partial [Selenomonadaceae bacterium]|nr:flagellin [Selenomonadaceae bacterium]